MELYILGRNLNTIGILDRVVEFTLTRHYFTPASLKLTIPDNARIPLGGEYLYDPLSGVCAVIESERLTSDGLIHVSGRGAESLLERRVIRGERVFFGNAELAMKRAVNHALDGDGAIPILQVSEELCGLTEVGHYTAYWDVLSDWLYRTAKPMGASYSVSLDFDLKRLVFKIIKGLDRTPAQTERSAVILSDTFGSLISGEITRDRSGGCNVAYVVGEDGTVATATAGTFSGADRRELYVSARDIFRSSFETDAEYLEALRQRGERKLSGATERMTLTGGGVGAFGGEYVCGVHFDLGDLCRLSFGGTYLDVRVTSVTDRRVGGSRVLTPCFG